MFEASSFTLNKLGYILVKKYLFVLDGINNKHFSVHQPVHLR